MNWQVKRHWKNLRVRPLFFIAYHDRLSLAFITDLSTTILPKSLTREFLVNALRPTIASKQLGSEDELALLVAEAALAVIQSNASNFNVDNIRVVKILGGSLSGSQVVRGMVFNREPEG